MFKVGLNIFRFFSSGMNRITVNKDSLVGYHGAGKLAVPATYADIVGSFRDCKIVNKRNHMNGFGRAAFGAGTACCVLRFNNTVLLYKNSLANLSKFLCFRHKRKQCTRGADFKTPCAFVRAETLMVIHVWHKDS